MKIAVYCGSGTGNNPIYVKVAKELGEWIGKNGHTLIYGGGDTGLMGELAKNAKKEKAYVVGVIPFDVAFIANRPQPYCDEVIKTKNMSERKSTMLNMADAYIALPGGIGTLDEISEAITLIKIGVYKNKQAVLFNKNGFYNPLKEMFRNMIDVDFMKADDVKSVCFAENINDIESFLK